MTTETINGLLTQKATSPPPTVGAIKSFAWEQRTSKAGKPWIKIKNETAEYGGKPCRIVQAQQTDFQDAHGNLSYNLEIEPVNGAQTPQDAPQGAETRQPQADAGENINEARRHLMKAANLYNLCIDATNSAIAGHLPSVAQTSEQFQATLASIWIEASGRRSTDGVTWWSYIDMMPTKPIKPKQEEKEIPF